MSVPLNKKTVNEVRDKYHAYFKKSRKTVRYISVVRQGMIIYHDFLEVFYMFGLSAGELLLIGLIALVLFGNEKLPENMKKMLKGWKEARKVTTNIQRSWYEVKSDIERDIYLEDEKKQLQELLKPVEIEEKAASQKADVV